MVNPGILMFLASYSCSCCSMCGWLSILFASTYKKEELVMLLVPHENYNFYMLYLVCTNTFGMVLNVIAAWLNCLK